MSSIIPVFRSHFSLQSGSLLSLEEPGKSKPGNAVSIFDLAKEGGLTDLVLIDDRIDGCLSAYKMCAKLGIKLCYGLKLTVCADCADNSVESRRTESKIVVFMTGGGERAYRDAVRLWSRAWGPHGHVNFKLGGDDYSYGRADWATIKEYWTENLGLGLPYTSSFVARNALSFNRITPDLPISPWILKEQDSGLPYASVIDSAIDRYATNTPSPVLPIKTICYARRADFAAYQVLRALYAGGTFEDPNVKHLCSDSWCWEAYKELTGVTKISTVEVS